MTLDVATYLCAHGYEVSVLTSHHHADAYPKDLPRTFTVVTLPQGNIKWSLRVARFVRDFIVEHHVAAFVSYRELLYARWLKRQTGAAFVFALQSMPFYEMKESSWFARRFYLNKYRRVYRAADAYGVLCDTYKQEIVRLLSLPTASHRVCVLPNSVRQTTNTLHPKQKELLFVGRLSRRDKRIDRLLRVWKIAQDKLPDWQLRIVGDGPERQSLQSLATDLHLLRISFEGFTTDVQSYYDTASIFCMTSSFEGWPLVIAEAQANGVVPVLFASFGACQDLVSSSNEGVLIEPFDKEAYARELIALALAEGRLQRMQGMVMQKARTYSPERTGRAWVQMLDRMMNHEL